MAQNSFTDADILTRIRKLDPDERQRLNCIIENVEAVPGGSWSNVDWHFMLDKIEQTRTGDGNEMMDSLNFMKEVEEATGCDFGHKDELLAHQKLLLEKRAEGYTHVVGIDYTMYGVAYLFRR